MAQRLRNWCRSHGVDSFVIRCTAVGAVLAFVACACFGKLVQVQLLDGQATAEAATNSRTSKVTISANRGRILASNGTVLAQSVERYNIIGVPDAATSFTPVGCGTKQAKSLGYCHSIDGKPVGASGAAAVARLLAPLLDMDAMELGAELNGTNQYVILKKDVTPQVKRAIDKLNLGGIVYGELSSQRVYAENTLLGALLGGVKADGTGASGLELTLNKQLSGTDGYTVYQQGNGGEVIPGTVTKTKAAQDGSDVTPCPTRPPRSRQSAAARSRPSRWGTATPSTASLSVPAVRRLWRVCSPRCWTWMRWSWEPS